MKEYLLNINKMWYCLNFISLILLYIFYKKHEYWCNKNKSLFGLLIISICICLGNLLPSWNEELTRYYEFISDVCLAYFTGFIFYFLTNIIKELKVLHLYYFKVVEFYSNYLSIVANSYYREKFSINKTSGEVCQNFKITIPIEKYQEFLKKDMNEIEKNCNYMPNYAKEKEKFTSSYKKNLKVKEIIKSLYQLLDSYELERISNIFEFFNNWSPLNTKGEELINDEVKKNYEYFYKNIPYIHDKIKKHLEEALEYLKVYKKFIPGIELEYKYLAEELKVEIYLNFYNNTKLKQYYVYIEKEKEKKFLIKEIKKLNGEYRILTENGQNLSFKNVESVFLLRDEVQLFTGKIK